MRSGHLPLRNPLPWAVSAILVAAACRPADGQNVSPRADYKPVAEALKLFIKHEMTDKRLPALSIALVDDQEIVGATGFGFASLDDSTTATAETVYRVGSIAKLITAIGVMQLAERGDVHLDLAVE